MSDPSSTPRGERPGTPGTNWETRLVRAEAPAELQPLGDGRRDRARVVPEQTGAEVAEQVEVLMAVDVDEPRAVRRGDPERERAGVEHRTGGAARQHTRRTLGDIGAHRPALGIPPVRLCEAAGEHVGVDGHCIILTG